MTTEQIKAINTQIVELQAQLNTTKVNKLKEVSELETKIDMYLDAAQLLDDNGMTYVADDLIQDKVNPLRKQVKVLNSQLKRL